MFGGHNHAGCTEGPRLHAQKPENASGFEGNTLA